MQEEDRKRRMEVVDEALLNKVYEDLFSGDYSGDLDQDLDDINIELSQKDEVEERWPEFDRIDFRVRASRIIEVHGSEDTYMARDLEKAYIVEIPVDVEEYDFCILNIDSDSVKTNHGVSRAELIALIDYADIKNSV